MEKLIRTDRNGTKYFESDECPKCGGTGYIDYYDYVAGGVCFLCGGTGHHHHTWVERTPEYEAKLAERRFARMKAGAAERNAKKMERLGFVNGAIEVVVGETYPIREQLKAEGARFYAAFGWYFGGKTERETVTVKADEIYGKTLLGDLMLREDALDIIDAKKREARPSASRHLYSAGEKVALELKLVRIATYETSYTYYGELNYIYVFEDADGNVYVWKTGKDIEEEQGATVSIKGTVKENCEYRGVKQTMLTRCKL